MTADVFTYKDTSTQASAKGGMLAGKKVVIQPNMSVRGWLTNAGSRALEGFVALEDATVVARLKYSGATIVGSSCMSELGFGLVGDTSSEIVSEGGADVALITDTMGEARMAASMSGLFGFKPSFGIVSRFGLIGLIPSMEAYGIIGKDPKDIVSVLKVISGRDDNDFSMSGETLPDFDSVCETVKTAYTVGIIRECLDVLNEGEVKAFKAALKKLEEAGMTVKELHLEEFHLFRAVHNVVGSVEASSSAGKYDGVRYGHRSPAAKNWNEMYINSRGESFGKLIKTYLFQGAYFQFENYPAFENACCIRRRLVNDTASLFDQADFIALPARRPIYDTSKVSKIAENYDAFSMTLPFNVTGQPAVQIPSFASDAGVDTGFQLIAPRLGDVSLLAACIGLTSKA